MAQDLHLIKSMEEVKKEISPEEKMAFEVDREALAQAATLIMSEYCPVVERKVMDPIEGEGIVSYFASGEPAFKVLLDEFEVPVMKVALGRGRLKEYIFAASGLTEEMVKVLAAEPAK